MTKSEQLLQECFNQIAKKMEVDNYPLGSFEVEVSNLYAQRISELFAEWIRTARVGINREKGFVYPRESFDYYTSEGLYTLFLNELNKEK